MGYRWSTCINEDHSVATSGMLSWTIEFEYKICMVGINLTWDSDRDMLFWQVPWRLMLCCLEISGLNLRKAYMGSI